MGIAKTSFVRKRPQIMVKNISLSANPTGNAFCLKQEKLMVLRVVAIPAVLLIFFWGNIIFGATTTQLITFILAALLYVLLFIYRPYSSQRSFINYTAKNLIIKDGIILIETFRWLVNRPQFFSFPFDDITIGESEYPYLDKQMVCIIDNATVNAKSLYVIAEFFTDINLFEDAMTDKIAAYIKKKGIEKTVSGIDIKEVNAGEISMGGVWTSTLHIKNHVKDEFVIEDVVVDNYLHDNKAGRLYFVRAHFIKEWYFKVGYYPLEEYQAYEFDRQFKAVYLKEFTEANKIGICLTMRSRQEGYDHIFDVVHEPAYVIN